MTCPECYGSTWSRSASGRCTWCRGTGQVHLVVGKSPTGTLSHAGTRERCEVHGGRACSAPPAEERAR